jgi:hypothetical protein
MIARFLVLCAVLAVVSGFRALPAGARMGKLVEFEAVGYLGGDEWISGGSLLVVDGVCTGGVSVVCASVVFGC